MKKFLGSMMAPIQMKKVVAGYIQNNTSGLISYRSYHTVEEIDPSTKQPFQSYSQYFTLAPHHGCNKNIKQSALDHTTIKIWSGTYLDEDKPEKAICENLVRKHEDCWIDVFEGQQPGQFKLQFRSEPRNLRDCLNCKCYDKEEDNLNYFKSQTPITVKISFFILLITGIFFIRHLQSKEQQKSEKEKEKNNLQPSIQGWNNVRIGD